MAEPPPTEPSGPYLQVTAGPAEGRVIPTDRTVLIGREGQGPGLIAEDEQLSRVHARVSRTERDEVRIEDLDSRNGTYVNGARVTEWLLSAGDFVQVGTSALELCAPEARLTRSGLHDQSRLNAMAADRVAAAGTAGDMASFRAEFPVFDQVSYLNAGSDGPVPRRAMDAASDHMQLVLKEGRAGPAYLRRLRSTQAALRSGYARVLGCGADEVALTGSTHDGVNTVLWGLDLRPGDEILTSDEEHLSVLAPLDALVARRGVGVRMVPFDDVAVEVGPRTRLVVCSHVSWLTGRVADVAAIVAGGAPVLLDGAQGLGAVSLDVAALGVDYYAASGQKWLCGPQGTACLYVRAAQRNTLVPPWPSATSLDEQRAPTERVYHGAARRLDTASPSGALAAWALASLEVLEEAGLGWIAERGPALAAALGDALAERGADVAPRGASTLVAWAAEDAESLAGRLADAGIMVRALPWRSSVRASVGAWNTEEELMILAQLVAGWA